MQSLDYITARSIPVTECGCWIWTGSVQWQGYGRAFDSVKKKQVPAHRLAWELVNGPIPEDLSACHTCDVPSCVNPDHIFIGSSRDNQLDSIKKGRHRSGPNQNVAKTHCKRGHPLSGSNLYLFRGGRACRTCRAADDRMRKALKRGEKII